MDKKKNNNRLDYIYFFFRRCETKEQRNSRDLTDDDSYELIL
jgi:hypothetical protein